MKEIKIEKSRHIYFMCPHYPITDYDQKATHLQFMMTGTKQK